MRLKFNAFFKDYDILLCPVAASAAFPHDHEHEGKRWRRRITVNNKRVPPTDQLFWAGYSGLVYLPSTSVRPASRRPACRPAIRRSPRKAATRPRSRSPDWSRRLSAACAAARLRLEQPTATGSQHVDRRYQVLSPAEIHGKALMTPPAAAMREPEDRAAQPRRARPHGERHPRARDGRGRAGEVRPSRPADGRGRHRDRAVHAIPEIRSGRSDMARPRPLRALGRPRLDAALRAAVSARLRGDDDRARSSASASSARSRPAIRRTSSRPASRPPPARSARGSATRSAWRSPSGISRREFGDDRRSPHLRARLRRRPDGRHQPGSDRARRASEAQPADRAVRRQRHFDRRPARRLPTRSIR